jgi:Tfp pilus assembly protein PilF
MRIIHKLDDFLTYLFPNNKDENQIISSMEEFYSYGTYKPKVTIENGFVIVDIDITGISNQENDFRKVISYCENEKFAEAKPILINLLENNPTNSEYHRILGQILSDEGETEEAINSLIYALRWDSKNAYALVMMGNIFARSKNDIETAMKYYDQALVVKPDDNITINNIGANLLQQNKFEEAKKYFYKALKLDSNYPNTHYALAMIADTEGDLQSAFYSFIMTAKTSKKTDQLLNLGIKSAFSVASKIFEKNEGKNIYRKYRSLLEDKGNVEIDIVKDDSIATIAKIEFAENYDRKKHVVKYKETNPSFPHLIMHELVHLEFVLDAKKAENNLLFTSTQQHSILFKKTIESSIKNLSKRGMPENVINNFSDDLFNGLNSQIFNAPIDLFIEDYLYNEFAELRPFQFVSLLNILQENIKAVTDKNVIDLMPKEIVSKSKIYNLVNALQIKDLYGLDVIDEFKSNKLELDQATKFYKEFLEYKDDKKPAEEYELVQNWANDLKLDNNFELIGENQYRQRSNIDSFIESLENDPFGVQEKDPIKEKEMEIFLESQKEIGTNMAVVMFMVDAMQYFKDISKDEIKKIAFEIAMQGANGYSPELENYRVNSIPNKKFSGYHILAYYYVSWAIAMPEVLHELQLPFDDEYKLAQQINKKS